MTTKDRIVISDIIEQFNDNELYDLFEFILDIVDWRLYKANLCDDFYAKGRPLLEKLARIANVEQ